MWVSLCVFVLMCVCVRVLVCACVCVFVHVSARASVQMSSFRSTNVPGKNNFIFFQGTRSGTCGSDHRDAILSRIDLGSEHMIKNGIRI